MRKKKEVNFEQLTFFDFYDLNPINETQETKVCSKCNRALSVDCFSPASGGKYLRPECRECASKLTKIRKKLYEEVEYPEDDYKCPICLKSLEEVKHMGGNAGPWVLDHNHDTEEFRGFLCHACNRALGNFNDDIERMKRAIKYLRNS